MWIVRLALSRPYTFVVLALVIILLTPVVLLRTPTDIFPEINIPVISLVWNYTGLEPQEMEQRITTNSERAVTTLVNDVEHIESQSLNGIAVVKIYFQPTANVQVALAQTTAIVQTILKQLAAWHHSSAGGYLFRFDRSRHSNRIDQRQPQRTTTLRLRKQFHSHTACHGAGRGASLSLRRKTAPYFGGHRFRRLAVQGTLRRRYRERHQRTEPDSADGNRETRHARISRGDERQPAERWKG